MGYFVVVTFGIPWALGAHGPALETSQTELNGTVVSQRWLTSKTCCKYTAPYSNELVQSLNLRVS